MTISSEDKEALINIKIEKAKKAMEDVAFLLENDKLTLAVTRIYYGMFYILSALALKHSFSTNKHQQLIGWFNKAFIKGNKIDEKYGRMLHTAYDKRSKSDYDDFVKFTREETGAMYSGMQDFIAAIIELIE